MAGRQVGEFPANDKKIKRSIPSPTDRATIVSIVPSLIDEPKYGIYPGRFVLQPGSFENPSVLTVGPSFWYYQPPGDGPMMEVTHSAVQMAESIIRDYCNGMLGCDMDNARPGLIFYNGEVSKKDIMLMHSDDLAKANERQKNWFANLVKLADGEWAKSNGNPLVIWDMMKVAAKDLGLETKEWVKDHIAAEKVRCIGCGGLKDAAYPICPSCRLIDQKHPLAKDLKFAQ